MHFTIVISTGPLNENQRAVIIIHKITNDRRGMAQRGRPSGQIAAGGEQDSSDSDDVRRLQAADARNEFWGMDKWTGVIGPAQIASGVFRVSAIKEDLERMKAGPKIAPARGRPFNPFLYDPDATGVADKNWIEAEHTLTVDEKMRHGRSVTHL